MHSKDAAPSTTIGMPVSSPNVCQGCCGTGRPNGATGTISPTRSRSTVSRSRSGSSAHVTGSTSAMRTVYPHCSTASAVATKVNAGTTAVGASARVRPAVARIAPIRALVPELAETTPPCGSRTWSASRASNSSLSGPQLVYVRELARVGKLGPQDRDRRFRRLGTAERPFRARG